MGVPSVPTHEGLDVAVLGFSAASSPVRLASASLFPYNPLLAVDVHERLALGDLGDVELPDGGAPGEPQHGGSAAALEGGGQVGNEQLPPDPAEPADALTALARAGIPWIALAGDDKALLAELRALAAVHGPVPVVRLDAHHGLAVGRDGAEVTTRTVLRRALERGLVDPGRSLVAGIRGPLGDAAELGLPTELGIDVMTHEELAAGGPGAFAERAHTRLGGGPAFLSFDIDFIDPAFAPGTATPVVGGPSSREALVYLRALAGVAFLAFDCLGVRVTGDDADTTHLVAATACFEMLSLAALRRG
jgi:agmatinase